VRLRAWWAGNDQRRELGRTKPLGDFESRNLHALVRLLGDADDGLVMKAEAYRELGEFSVSESLLAADFEGPLSQVVSIIRDLNQKRDPTVAEIHFK
jgi:hypothetical protein